MYMHIHVHYMYMYVENYSRTLSWDHSYHLILWILRAVPIGWEKEAMEMSSDTPFSMWSMQSNQYVIYLLFLSSPLCLLFSPPAFSPSTVYTCIFTSFPSLPIHTIEIEFPLHLFLSPFLIGHVPLYTLYLLHNPPDWVPSY